MIRRNKIHKRFVIQFGPTMTYTYKGDSYSLIHYIIYVYKISNGLQEISSKSLQKKSPYFYRFLNPFLWIRDSRKCTQLLFKNNTYFLYFSFFSQEQRWTMNLIPKVFLNLRFNQRSSQSLGLVSLIIPHSLFLQVFFKP
jgi:hypothetical protein